MRSVFVFFNRWRRRRAHLAPETSAPRAFVRWMAKIGEVDRIPVEDWHDVHCDMCELSGEEPSDRSAFYSEAWAALVCKTDAEIDVVAALVRLKARGHVGVSNDELAREMGVSKGESSKRRAEAKGCTSFGRSGKFLRIYLSEPLAASSSGANLAPDQIIPGPGPFR